MEIEQLAVERPEALARVAVDPIAGIDEAKAREIVDRRRLRRRDRAPRSPPVLAEALGRSTATRTRRWSRSTRWCKTEDGEIVALDGKVTLDENAGFRHPDHEALEDKAAADPLEARGQGEGPQLRQARRRGRHHRQRRRARHEHPRRRRLRRRGVRRRRSRPTSSTSAAAPRPRSWPTASTSSSATRRSRACSSTSSAASPPATRWPTASSARSTILGDEATKPLVVRLDGNNVEEGRRILAERQPPAA